MKITLIRHGKPAFVFKGKVRSGEVYNHLQYFDESGILDEPTQGASQAVTGCKIIFCSDLARSCESAEKLSGGNVCHSNEVFREVSLPYFNKGSLKLPIKLWLVMLRFMSVFGFSQNGESLTMARRRAKLAASVLIDAAQNHNSVLLVGHGFINSFIAKELLSKNWSGPSKLRSNYWGYGVYKYNV